MPTFEAATAIAAPASHVWDTLLRTERWTEWDTQLERVDGRLEPDGRIEIRVVGTSRPFRLRVTTWEPQQRIVLSGGMPLGLFTGTRRYLLDSDGAGTSFTMGESYSGPLAGMIGKSIPDLQPSFEAFVAGLRAAAER
jgi:uncharacterized protein YndB with AHSA1/START domain